MEILWLDGDIMESWDDLVEHLWACVKLEGPDDEGYYIFYGGRFKKDDLIELLKTMVSLNTQLYDAWGLLYEFLRLVEPHYLEPLREKVEAYLRDPTGWGEKE